MTQQTPRPPQAETSSNVDRALFWFQLYGKQFALAAALFLLLTIALLIFFARKSDTKIDRAIEASIVASKLYDDQSGTLSLEERVPLVKTLEEGATSSSALMKQYQGLIGQELLLTPDLKEALPYIQGAKNFLQQQDLPIFDQMSTLSETLSRKDWVGAKSITDNLLTLAQFNPQDTGNFLPVSYFYLLLSRWMIFYESKSHEELIRTQEQLKALLGISQKQKCIPEKVVEEILPLIKEGSVSLFDVGQELI